MPLPTSPMPRCSPPIDEGGAFSLEVGGGAVVAVADGSMRIREVRIDPAMMGVLVDGDGEQDRSMAQDLVASAVNAALSRAQDMISTHLQEAAAELGLPLPPGGLPGLL